MRVVVSLVVGLVALFALPFAGLGVEPAEVPEEAGPDDGPSLHGSVGTTTSHLVWSTTESGDRAIRLTLDFDGFELCGFHIVSGGWQSDPVYQFTSHERDGGGWTAVTDHQLLHAHGSNVAVRTAGFPGNAWIAEAWHGFSASGTITFLYAGFDLIPIPHEITAGKSITFDLECTGPFTITKVEAGTTVLGAVPSFLTGGAGASVGGASVNVLDTAGRTFDEPSTTFRLRTESSFQAGLLRVTAPGGAGGTHSLGGDSDITHHGASGAWRAEFTRVGLDAVGPTGVKAVALFAGLQEVSSLDAAAAL